MVMPGRDYSAGSPYRFGFNGKEKDKNLHSLTVYDYGFRIYDPRIGKFLSVDPLSKNYPSWTPYAFAMNDVIRSIDLDGLERYIVIYNQKGDVIKKVDFYSIEEGAHGNLGYGTVQAYPDETSYTENGSVQGAIRGNWGKKAMKESVTQIAMDIIGRVVYPFYQQKIDRLMLERDLNSAEKYVIRNDASKADKVSNSADHASAVSRDTRQILGTSGVDDISDAIRHAFWTILMAKKAGSDFSKKMSDAHEEDGEQQPIGRKLMDLHNNAVGLLIYKQNSGKNLQELYELVIDQAAKGNLQVYDNVSKTNSPSSLTQEQAQSLKELDVVNIKIDRKFNY
jgi:RHS repeat-associated protein